MWARCRSTASGTASAVEVRGTVHWLTHRDGPARALSVAPGVRARYPQVLGRRRSGRLGDRRRRHRRAGDRRRRPAELAAPSRPRRRAGSRPGRSAASAGSPPRRTAARSPSPRRTAGCAWSTSPRARCGSSPRPPTAASPGWPGRRTRPGWPGRSRPSIPAAWATAAAPAAAGPDRRRPGHRHHRRAVRRHRAGLHPRRQVPGVPVPAQLRPGLRRALLRPVVPLRRPALPAAAGRRRRPRRSPRSWAAGRSATPGPATRPRRRGQHQRRRTATARHADAATATRRPPGRHRGPGGMADRVVRPARARVPVLAPARGEGRAGLAARARDRQSRRRRRAADRRRAAAGPGALRLRPARGQRAGRRRGLVRGQRRRHQAGRQRPGQADGPAGGAQGRSRQSR